MKIQKIKNQNDRAVERAKGVTALKDEYGNMSINEIIEVILKDAVALANQNERFKMRLGKKHLKLFAALDGKLEVKRKEREAELEDAKERNDFRRTEEIKNSLQQYNIWKAELDKLKEMDISTPEAIERLKQIFKELNGIKLDQVKNEGKMEQQRAKNNAKVDEIKAQGDVNVTLIQERGKNESAQLSAERAGLKAARFHNGIFGVFRRTRQDLEAKWLEYDTAIVKGNKRVAQRALRRISRIMKHIDYTPEEMKRLSDAILQLQHVERGRDY